jgi:hypothetical protein
MSSFEFMSYSGDIFYYGDILAGFLFNLGKLIKAYGIKS